MVLESLDQGYMGKDIKIKELAVDADKEKIDKL